MLQHCHDKTSIEVWTQCMDPENIVSDPPRIVIVNAFRFIEKPPAFEIVFLELIVAGGAIRRGLRNVDIAQCVENEIDDRRKQQPIIVGRDGCVYSEEPRCNLMLFSLRKFDPYLFARQPQHPRDIGGFHNPLIKIRYLSPI